MEMIGSMIVKQFEDHKEHFTQRLLERYGIQLLDGEYEDICLNVRFKYHGIMSKSSIRSIGYVYIQGIKVYVLYNSKLKCFPTCYPIDVEDDLDSALRACFGIGIRPLAQKILDACLKESETLPNFDTVKDAAIYYFLNTMFPQVHIEKYKGGKYDTMKTMHQINRIINNEHNHVELIVQRKS